MRGERRLALGLGTRGLAYVPMAARSAVHVSLPIVDEVQPGTEAYVADAAESASTLILNVDILGVNAS